MKDFFSPGSLVTIAGGVLTVVGATAYATGSANLSLPTIFYGIPILLGGLALKSSELPPAIRVTPVKTFQKEREAAAPELGKLLGDVTRWRYGQKAHLESSLEALKLWDEDTPPQLEEIEAAGRSRRRNAVLRSLQAVAECPHPRASALRAMTPDGPSGRSASASHRREACPVKGPPLPVLFGTS